MGREASSCFAFVLMLTRTPPLSHFVQLSKDTVRACPGLGVQQD